jgi:uncharacterized delta-60 repeat protein
MKYVILIPSLWRGLGGLRLGGLLVFGFFVSRGFGALPNASGSLDLTFDPTAGGRIVGLSGGSPIVHTVLVQTDGKVLLSGWFNGVNGALRNNIARLLADGSVDSTFQPGYGPDAEVTGLALQPDGKVLLIGGFSAVSAQPHALIARLNANGSLDSTFNCRIGGDVQLRLDGLALEPSGKIWIGGRFTNVNGVARLNLARLNPDGTLDESFDLQRIVSGTNTAIHRIRIQPDGKVLVSGTWIEPQRSLIRLNPDGSLDDGFGPVVVRPSGYYQHIYDMFTHTDGTVAVVGEFENINGVTRRCAARLRANGALDPSFNADFGRFSTAAGSVVVQPDGKVVVGGWFSEASGTQRLGLARLNADGTVDPSFDSTNVIGRPFGTSYQPDVRALALQTNGQLVVGAFAWWLEDNTNVVFRLDAQGRRDPGFTTLLQGAPSTVANPVLQSDGKVVVSVLGKGWPQLLRLNANGLVDESFHPDPNLQGANALAIQPDGKILINHGEPGILRLHADGSRDTAFQSVPIWGYDQGIETVVVQPDGKILVGGLLTQVDGRVYPGIARLHADGRLDTNFSSLRIQVGDDAGDGVEHILLLAGGKIFIAGRFRWDDGVASPAGLALLNPDGTLDTNFLANIPGPAYIGAAALQADDKILLSGTFVDAGGGYRDEFVRLYADGRQDITFQPAIPGEFRTLVVQPDGRILAVRGWETNSLVRFHPDGTLDSTFTGLSELKGVERVALQPDGQLLVAGWFHSVNGIPMHGIARLNNDVRWRLDLATPAQPGEFRFRVTGRPGARLVIEASSDLTRWTRLGELTTSPAAVFFADPAAAQFDQRFYRARAAE